MEPEEYFKKKSTTQKKYEVMKAFYQDGMEAKDVAEKFGYTIHAVYTLTKKFRKDLEENPDVDPFFVTPKKGRPFKDNSSPLIDLIVSLRKKNLSVPEIKSIIDSVPGFDASESYIDYVLKKEGFSRLPRRSQEEREKRELPEKIRAEKSTMIDFDSENFEESMERIRMSIII